LISRNNSRNGFEVERPAREKAFSSSSSSSHSKPRFESKNEDEDEDEDDGNKKAFIPAKQRMKALGESPSAHAEWAGLILLLTEKLAGKTVESC
jgi:hypothetical protein